MFRLQRIFVQATYQTRWLVHELLMLGAVGLWVRSHLQPYGIQYTTQKVRIIILVFDGTFL